MLGDSYFSFKNNNDLKLNSFFSIFLVSINTFAFFGLPSYSFEKVQDELQQKKPTFSSENQYGMNHIYGSSFTLKEIPEKKTKDNKIAVKKNPFLMETSEGGGVSSLFLNSLKVNGVITIGDSNLTIVSSIYGTDTFEVGDLIGDGYLIKKINTNPATVLVSNNKYSRLFILED